MEREFLPPPAFGFIIASTAIEPEALRGAMTDPRAGAFLVFEGWVRNQHDGRAVSGLDYEAYVEMAELEGRKILVETQQRFGVLDARCVHRVGRLELGGLAVWVGVSAGHRDAAFAACRHVIDEVKARVPIWKREHYVDAESAWLHPQR